MKPLSALLVSLIVGFIGAVLVLGLPLIVGYGACGFFSWFGLCNTTTYLQGALIAIGLFTAGVGIVGLGLWWVFSKIPSGLVKLGIAGVILLVGILTFQPEIDFMGLVGLAFAFSADKRLTKK